MHLVLMQAQHILQKMGDMLLIEMINDMIYEQGQVLSVVVVVVPVLALTVQ